MADASTNLQQRVYWTEIAGPVWLARERLFDRMIGPHGEAVLEALAAQPGEQFPRCWLRLRHYSNALGCDRRSGQSCAENAGSSIGRPDELHELRNA
jgi:hypothetical protein